MSVALSPNQKKIVESADGPMLVVAAAGSGKTRILTERVRYLLEEKKTPSRILALTFTNKAAGEMRERLENISGLADRAYIGTIHSFCQTIIQAYGNVLGFPEPPTIFDQESDRIAVLEEVFIENPELSRLLNKKRTDRDRRNYLYEILKEISAWKRDWDQYSALRAGDWPDHLESLVFRDYNERLQSHGAIDFDDVLLNACEILRERPKVAQIYHRTYRYICVDEAQDLNAVQYSIIKTLAEDSRNILMVGDPHQAIYGFNGSSKDFMLKQFPSDFPDVLTIELRENYRSSRAVILAANALYPDSIDPSTAVLNGVLRVQPCANEAEEARWIVDRIDEHLKLGIHPDIEGPVTPERIAVLARNRYLFPPLEKDLEERGLSFHLRKPASDAALESEFGKALDLGLRILVNPRDELHRKTLGTLLKTDLPSAMERDDPVEFLGSVRVDGSFWSRTWPELVTACRTLDRDFSQFPQVMTGLDRMLRESAKEHDSSTASEEWAVAIADIEYLQQVWKNYTRHFTADARGIGHFRNQMAMGVTVPHGDPKGLTLGTIHTVKGLEYDIVFVMGLCEGSFPDYRAVRAGGNALAEEKNDAFVAITRSKRLLYLSWPKARFMPWDMENRVRQNRSRFLDEIIRKYDESITDPVFQVAENPHP